MRKATMRRALLLRMLIVLSSVLQKLLCGKFQICGKTPGLLTASRGAAFASRYVQKCGKDIILGYPWTTAKLKQVSEKGCLGLSLCYAHNEHKRRKSDLTFRQGVRECLVRGMRAIYILKPVTFHFTQDEFFSIMQHFNNCLRGDMLPMDVSVAQGLMRYFIKRSSMVPNR
ncbi:uncharacterized protein LOC119178448 isoform X2 [Rhipicephalus microplus]|uniref:uncharacterized protein LOC119178448 isoform X2 n=1 Tax=Rhipicephalus microplus TaxID=6941 RepID=UPI003F6B8931